jgi:tetratricopeptide (TPR) repeat protein
VQRLYGRDGVIERAGLRVAEACGGSGRVVLFTGEPGIGKSRMAEQVASEAAARGAVVAWGRCWEAGGAPAYWPWIQLFRQLGLDTDPFAGATPNLEPRAAEARFAAFDRAVASLSAAAGRQPLALVLDDLHAADTPSLLLLVLLVRQLIRSPILVVGAYRDAASLAAPDVAALLATVAREADVWPLQRLSPQTVAAWARDAVSSFGETQTAELYRVTEGHPLFVVELLRLGARAGSPGAWPAGPGVLDERLGAVSPQTRALLQVAAVCGRDFASDVLASAAGAEPDHVARALREALATSLVVPGDSSHTHRFSHVLLRDRLYDELLPSERQALHWRVGQARLVQGAAPEAVIHHLFEGCDAGSREPVAELALAAAEAELARLAFEEAARIGRRALELCSSGPLPARLEAPLRLVVAEALIRLGKNADGKRLCTEAAALAEQAGADDLSARAALVYGTELASGTIDPTMVALLRQALVRLGTGPSALRARVMARLAAALTPPEREHIGEIVDLMRGAIAMARTLPDRRVLSYVMQFGATVALLVPERERFAMLAETLELARSLDQPLVLLSTLPAYITAALAKGERARAEAELPAYDVLLQEFRQPLHRLRRLLVEALFATLSGHDEAAERASAEARELARHDEAGPGMLLWLTHRFSLAQLRARPDLIVAEAPLLLAYFGKMPAASSYSTWLLAAMGQREEALERLRHAPLEPLEIASANLMDLMGAAETSVLLGDALTGERVYPLLLRASDRMLWNMGPAALLGTTQRVLGDLARCIGRPSEAVRHYDAAIAFAEKLQAPALVEPCARGRALAVAAMAPAAMAPVPMATANPTAPEPLAPARAAPVLRREGELWLVAAPGGPERRLKHSKGLGYLEALLASPGRPVHVIELAGVEHLTGDAGAVLDPRAKHEYRQRLEDLGDALAEAERFGDAERAARARREIDALAEQLAQAVGLGGRDRRAASDVERTRVNVQRRLKDAIQRITAADPALGRYFAATVQTGTYCVYQPL